MLKKLYILSLLLLLHTVKAQYFDPETYVTDNLNITYTSNSDLNKIIQTLKKNDNNSVLRALEEMPSDSITGINKAMFYLLKSAYYSKTHNYKSALENALMALRFSQKNNLNYHAEQALLLQATIYYRLNASKNITSLGLNVVENSEINYQLNYFLAQSYLKLNDNEVAKTTFNRLSETENLSNYDYVQTLKIYSTALERLGDYGLALKITYKIDSLLEAIKNQPFSLATNNKLVYTTITAQNFDKKILQEQFISKNNIGFLLLKIKEIDKAETFFNSALKISKISGHRESELEAEKNIGICNTLLKRYTQADDHYLNAEKICAALNNPNKQAELLCIRAKNFYLVNNLSKARELCSNSIDLAQSTFNYYQLSQSYSVLAEINAFVGDIQKAAHFSELAKEYLEKASRENAKSENEDRANALREEVANDVFSKEKAELELIQLKLEATKRYQELEIIKRENQVKESNLIAQKLESEKSQQALLIVKRELEALNQIKELEEMKKDRSIKILENKNSQTKIRLLRKQKKLDDEIKMQREKDVILARSRERNLRIFLIISLIITALIVFLLYRNLRNAKALKSANNKLEQLTQNLKASNTAIENTLQEVNAKNEIIELKNSQILESINYAKRIQEASLPKTEELAKIAKDSFVLNKPKDIISGDFYIVDTVHDQFNNEFDVYIVGDCTGHGVPGAMLSLLCSSLVRQSMKVQTISKPAELLNDVNERLRSFFRNKEDDSFKDGMDIACCLLDKKNKKLIFSGAGRPLLCIRSNEAIELKGEKHHIGFSNSSFDFNDQELELQSGDTIYLYTDGFTDQFNGVTRKRFMTKGLKQLLCTIQHQPMKKQEELLDKAFEEWRGEYVQMDDVCVLGIRIQ